MDTSFVKAFRDIFGFIAGRDSSFFSMYRFADGTSESRMGGNPNPTKAIMRFFRDNQLIQTVTADLDKLTPLIMAGSNIPDNEGDLKGQSYSGPGIGSYRVEIDRVGMFNGEDQTDTFSSELEFNISSSSTDSIPPTIKTIQLVSGGILQNHFDPSNPGEIRLFIDPGPGIQTHNANVNADGAYEITFMPDSVASIVLYGGDSYEQLTPLPAPQLVGDYYSVDLSSITTASYAYKYFKLEIVDMNGNSIKYNFAIEVGESLDAEEIADEFLLICVQNPPLITTIPQVPILTNPNAFIPVQIALTNQDTIACNPRTFNLSILTALYPPLSGLSSPKVRATTNANAGPNVQTTSMFSSISSVGPGQTKTSTIYMRPDQALQSGVYQIGLQWRNGTGYSASILGDYPFSVNVGNIVQDPVNICSPANPSISFNPNIPSVDSGGSYTTFSFTVTNQDSVDCDPKSFNVSFDTDQYVSFENGNQKIRGTATNPGNNTFMTTEFSVSTGLLNPGQSITKTAHIRTDEFFPNGQYQIGAILSDSSLTTSQAIQYFVSAPYTVT